MLIENQVERESIEAILQAEGLIDTIEKLDYYLTQFSSLRLGPKEGS